MFDAIALHSPNSLITGLRSYNVCLPNPCGETIALRFLAHKPSRKTNKILLTQMPTTTTPATRDRTTCWHVVVSKTDTISSQQSSLVPVIISSVIISIVESPDGIQQKSKLENPQIIRNPINLRELIMTAGYAIVSWISLLQKHISSHTLYYR